MCGTSSVPTSTRTGPGSMTAIRFTTVASRNTEGHRRSFPGRRRQRGSFVARFFEEHLDVASDALDTHVQIANNLERADEQQKRNDGGYGVRDPRKDRHERHGPRAQSG